MDELNNLIKTNDNIKRKFDKFLGSVILNKNEKYIVDIFQNNNKILIKKFLVKIIDEYDYINNTFSLGLNKILLYVNHDILDHLKDYQKIHDYENNIKLVKKINELIDNFMNIEHDEKYYFIASLYRFHRMYAVNDINYDELLNTELKYLKMYKCFNTINTILYYYASENTKKSKFKYLIKKNLFYKKKYNWQCINNYLSILYKSNKINKIKYYFKYHNMTNNYNILIKCKRYICLGSYSRLKIDNKNILKFCLLI